MTFASHGSTHSIRMWVARSDTICAVEGADQSNDTSGRTSKSIGLVNASPVYEPLPEFQKCVFNDGSSSTAEPPSIHPKLIH